MNPQPDDTTRLCLLECWLPLLQAMNQHHGWRFLAAQLEQIVTAAAPDLPRISTLADARAVLYDHATHVYGEPQ